MKRKLLAVLVVGMLSVCTVACGSEKQVVESEKIEQPESESEEETETGDLSELDALGNIEVDEDKEWKAAYMDYLSEFVVKDNLYNMCEYYLIYVDDNDVPELFIDTGIEASGEYVVTYYKNETIEKHLDRIGSEFIERSGLILTNTGHMGYLPLTITKLENGSFTVVAEGLCVWSNEGTDEQTVTCEWEGESVSMHEFEKNLGEIYDKEKSLRPDDGYTFDEMVSILITEE